MVSLKGSNIIIKNEQDLYKMQTALSQIQAQYTPFLVFELTTMINIMIVDKIQEKMRRAGVSRKVIDRTYLDRQVIENGREIIFTIKSDYISETGFPVARMIEYGRRAYTVRVKYKKALSWIDEGVRKFARQTNIPVKPGLFAIVNTIRSETPKIQRELNKRTKKWISSILKS